MGQSLKTGGRVHPKVVEVPQEDIETAYPRGFKVKIKYGEYIFLKID